MKDIIQKILKEEKKLKSHILTDKLPVELDNRLYTLSHLIGGIDFKDVIIFANNATKEQIRELYRKVLSFPSEQHELLPLAGGFEEVLHSDSYQEIIDLVKFGTNETSLLERVDYDIDGYPTTETNPYFTRYLSPTSKKSLFKLWDKLGNADYDSLKLFGVQEDSDDTTTDFRNVGDVLYPVLAIEWMGGIQNTKFAKLGYSRSNESGFAYLKFRIEPIRYDYMFDESENFGEHGYACWDIRVLIDKISDFDPPSERQEGEIPFVQELFPESAQNKLTSFRNYTEDQMELIEMLWEYYSGDVDFTPLFCRVEVVLVDDKRL